MQRLFFLISVFFITESVHGQKTFLTIGSYSFALKDFNEKQTDVGYGCYKGYKTIFPTYPVVSEQSKIFITPAHYDQDEFTIINPVTLESITYTSFINTSSLSLNHYVGEINLRYINLDSARFSVRFAKVSYRIKEISFDIFSDTVFRKIALSAAYSDFEASSIGDMIEECLKNLGTKKASLYIDEII